ncbi:alpha-1,2-fucosyltransferase [Erysipelotrichia bacterium]
MIIVELYGGLGNQMFEYALGRHLAILNNTVLKLATSQFERHPLRNYALNCFRIQEEFASESEIRMHRYGFSGRLPSAICHYLAKISDRLGYKFPLRRPGYFIENETLFRPEILEARGDIYLSGYWQTEKYFQIIRETLLRDFTFKEPPDAENARILAMIMAAESVSVHVRRGDYVNNPATREIHNCCDAEYYARATRIIKERLSSPHFFIFSDDPDWVRGNFRVPGPMTVVAHNSGKRDHEDMRLMSACRHNILANSSFSWWGAWLNSEPSKIVIAPQRWYNSDKFATRDLIPEEWLKL